MRNLNKFFIKKYLYRVTFSSEGTNFLLLHDSRGAAKKAQLEAEKELLSHATNLRALAFSTLKNDLLWLKALLYYATYLVVDPFNCIPDIFHYYFLKKTSLLYKLPSVIKLDCTSRYVIFYLHYSNKGSGVYQVSTGNNQHTSVYCQMSSISGCHGGGWTLVMKINGRYVRLCEYIMI